MPTLVLAIGLLVLLAVGSILSVQWVTGRGMIQEFASRLIARGLATNELALRRHLDAGVREYVPGNSAKYDRIVQFLVRHGDLGLEQHDQGPRQGQEHIRKSVGSGIAECRH